MSRIRPLPLCAFLFVTLSTVAQTRMSNQEALRLFYQADYYDLALPRLSSVKVAVLDNGFAGFAPGRDLLPANVQLITPPLAIPSGDSHGLGMAQILWGLTTRPVDGPQMFLLNTQGYTNFKAAIDFVIREKIDVVVYSQNWFFGANFGPDGTSPEGFINAQVNRALDAGVLWLNSAGNVHKMVYAQDIKVHAATGLVDLPGDFDSIRFKNDKDDNSISLTLTWNDFRDSDAFATNKDLDVNVTNLQGTAIPFPNKVQKGEAPVGNDDTRSSHARETATLNLDAGTYIITLADRSGNFVSGDRLRATLYSSKPDSVRWLSGLGAGASYEVMAPADNPRVLAVGDCSDISARNDRSAGKPDIVLPDSVVRFTDGTVSYGSSNAAALFGGIVSLMKAQEPRLDLRILKNYIASLKPGQSGFRESCLTHRVWKTPTPTTLSSWMVR